MNQEIILASPLILISSLSIVLILVDAYFKNRTLNHFLTLIILGATGAAALATATVPDQDIALLMHTDLVTKGQITFGGISAFFDVLFISAGILTALSAKQYLRREYAEYGEFYSMMVFSIVGMMLIAHSNSLLVLFIGIELMTISFYVLSGFFRKREKSVESAVKYFLLGSFATGFLLYGMAMIYGSTGHISFNGISSAIAIGAYTPLYLLIGMGLLIVGLSFKIAAFPFHQWAPDVYEGAPTVVTGFMSTAGKIAAAAAFIIVSKSMLAGAMQNSEATKYFWNYNFIVALVAVLTMFVGNISALVQTNVKRMLAYSSIAHAGYLLMGIAAGTPMGFSAIGFYSAAYLFMQFGAFAVVSSIEKNGEMMNLDDYAGLSQSQPLLAAMMSVFMFSLAGLPPFAGFLGKYYLFAAAVKSNMVWLTVAAVVATMISMYFYIGLIIKMYFQTKPDNPPEADTRGIKPLLWISCLALIALGLFPSIITSFF